MNLLTKIVLCFSALAVAFAVFAVGYRLCFDRTVDGEVVNSERSAVGGESLPRSSSRHSERSEESKSKILSTDCPDYMDSAIVNQKSAIANRQSEIPNPTPEEQTAALNSVVVKSLLQAAKEIAKRRDQKALDNIKQNLRKHGCNGPVPTD